MAKAANAAPSSSRGPPPGLGSQQKTGGGGGGANASNGWIGSGLGGAVGRGGSVGGGAGGPSNWASGTGVVGGGGVNPNASWNSTWLLLKNLTAQVPFTVYLAPPLYRAEHPQTRLTMCALMCVLD